MGRGSHGRVTGVFGDNSISCVGIDEGRANDETMDDAEVGRKRMTYGSLRNQRFFLDRRD